MMRSKTPIIRRNCDALWYYAYYCDTVRTTVILCVLLWYRTGFKKCWRAKQNHGSMACQQEMPPAATLSSTASAKIDSVRPPLCNPKTPIITTVLKHNLQEIYTSVMMRSRTPIRRRNCDAAHTTVILCLLLWYCAYYGDTVRTTVIRYCAYYCDTVRTTVISHMLQKNADARSKIMDRWRVNKRCRQLLHFRLRRAQKLTR